jgi:hypothetical protein
MNEADGGAYLRSIRKTTSPPIRPPSSTSLTMRSTLALLSPSPENRTLARMSADASACDTRFTSARTRSQNVSYCIRSISGRRMGGGVPRAARVSAD